MKTQEELNALKEEVETLNKKLSELTDDELEQVSSGNAPDALPFLPDDDAPDGLQSPHPRRRPDRRRSNPRSV